MNQQAPNPTESVLIGYANENLQLKLEVARLQAQVQELEQPTEQPDEG